MQRCCTIGTMPEKRVALNLRLPAEIHEALKQEAQRDDRSLSNLIVHVLREWTDRRADDRKPPASANARP